MPWIVESVGATQNRFKVHQIGKTTLEMIKGRRPHRLMAAFGEKVMYLIQCDLSRPRLLERYKEQTRMAKLGMLM